MTTWTRIPTDREARLVFVVGLVLVFLLLLHFPLWGKVFASARVFRDRQKAQVQLANVERLVDEIRIVDENQKLLLDQASIVFPSTETVPHIVDRLEGLGESAAIALDIQAIEERKDLADTKKLLPLDLTVVSTGSPHALLTFMEMVEHMQEFTQVEQWNIQSVQVGATPKIYTLFMKVRFYLQSS